MRPASYKGIVDELAAAIRSGTLPAGTLLPAHRALAPYRFETCRTVSNLRIHEISYAAR
jgi:DNA-binding FadR family transcriptional regulator